MNYGSDSKSSQYTIKILQTRYQELLQYGAVHGDYNVPYQRANYVKQKKGVTEMPSLSSSSATAFLPLPSSPSSTFLSSSLSSSTSASSNSNVSQNTTLGVGVDYVLPVLCTSHGLSEGIIGPSSGMYLGKSPVNNVRYSIAYYIFSDIWHWFRFFLERLEK